MSEAHPFNKQNLVDIKTLLKQLTQLVEQAEWNGEPCEHLVDEYNHIYKYHMETGSRYYPMF